MIEGILSFDERPDSNKFHERSSDLYPHSNQQHKDSAAHTRTHIILTTPPYKTIPVPHLRISSKQKPHSRLQILAAANSLAKRRIIIYPAALSTLSPIRLTGTHPLFGVQHHLGTLLRLRTTNQNTYCFNGLQPYIPRNWGWVAESSACVRLESSHLVWRLSEATFLTSARQSTIHLILCRRLACFSHDGEVCSG